MRDEFKIKRIGNKLAFSIFNPYDLLNFFYFERTATIMKVKFVQIFVDKL